MEKELIKSLCLNRSQEEHLLSKFFFYSFTPNWSTEEEIGGSFCWHGCDKVSSIGAFGGGGS